MKRLLCVLTMIALMATTAQGAAMVSGVGAITTSVGSIAPPGLGETNLVNTGTILDGLYGTENQAYLVDDYPGALSYTDDLFIKATVTVNDEGTVSGADNVAMIGYSNPVTGDRGEYLFGLGILGPNDGRIYPVIGTNRLEPLPGINWASDVGRNAPFDINVSLSLDTNTNIATMTGTIAGVAVSDSREVNPNTPIEVFGTSQGLLQQGVQRNFGLDFSNVMYMSTVPEPTSLVLLGLAAVGLLVAGRKR